MSLSRAQLLTRLQNTYAILLSEAALTITDTSAGLGPALDDTLRELGVAEDDLAAGEIENEDILDAIELGGYFVLLQIANIFAIRTSVSVDGLSVGQNQQFSAVMKLLEAKRAALTKAGYLRGAGRMTYGSYTLDFQEPYS